jgi:hypothetical protein
MRYAWVTTAHSIPPRPERFCLHPTPPRLIGTACASQLMEADHWAVCLIFVFIAVFGGLFLVNLFLAVIFQARDKHEPSTSSLPYDSRIIA